jgi:hypothetical protein
VVGRFEKTRFFEVCFGEWLSEKMQPNAARGRRAETLRVKVGECVPIILIDVVLLNDYRLAFTI